MSEALTDLAAYLGEKLGAKIAGRSLPTVN